MNKPIISIIVPVYNVEQYLLGCIDSIINQSFTNFELILVDDGSPDKCPQMCDNYAQQDSRIVVLHKDNGGLSSARNYALDRACGKYIIFVDSDDKLAPESLKTLYNEIITTDADIVLGKVIRFSKDGTSRPYTRLEEKRAMTGKEALSMLLKGYFLNISVCGGIYKKEIWDNIRMPLGYICEDWYVTPSLYFKATKVVFIPVLYYLYRDDPASTMGHLNKRANPQVIEVAEHVIDVIKDADYQLYLSTLWSNLKRVWKYVGIIYSQGRQKDEKEFLFQARVLLQSYWHDLLKAGKMNFSEKIGVWSFCYCEMMCRSLYRLKNK